MKRPKVPGRHLARLALLGVFLAGSAACMSVKVEPIHITMDVNVKVDKKLDNFFGDLDAPAAPKAP